MAIFPDLRHLLEGEDDPSDEEQPPPQDLIETTPVIIK